MIKELPSELFVENGFLRKEVQEIMHLVFGFETIGLSQTRFIEGTFKFGAITFFRKIIFDRSFHHTMNLKSWFVLIVHEQVHREDIIQNPLKGIGFYLSYLFHWLKAGFSYRGNQYEQKAYGIEARARELWRFKENALEKVLNGMDKKKTVRDIAEEFRSYK